MKIQIALSGENPRLPKWQNFIDGDRYLQFVRGGKLPFGRTSLKVTASPWRYSAEDWFGTWKVSPSGEITIYIEQKFFDACVRKNALWALTHLIQHEYIEVKTAISYARKKDPDSNPYIPVERDESYGGEAHLFAIAELDGLSEVQYDRNCTLERNFLFSK